MQIILHCRSTRIRPFRKNLKSSVSPQRGSKYRLSEANMKLLFFSKSDNTIKMCFLNVFLIFLQADLEYYIIVSIVPVSRPSHHSFTMKIQGVSCFFPFFFFLVARSSFFSSNKLPPFPNYVHHQL